VEQFSSRLRRLRESRGITSYRLAQLTGLSKQGAINLEQAGADPKLSTVLRLAEALGVEPCELLPAPAGAGKSRPRGHVRRG
jgi:transcriptional regulator with XRE-family HTH domain